MLFRKRDKKGKFKPGVVKKVWDSWPIDSRHPDGKVKFDRYGKKMRFEDHGKRRKGTGWEIDHKKPSSRRGKDSFKNLEPMQWANNVRKSNKYITK